MTIQTQLAEAAAKLAAEQAAVEATQAEAARLQAELATLPAELQGKTDAEITALGNTIVAYFGGTLPS